MFSYVKFSKKLSNFVPFTNTICLIMSGLAKKVLSDLVRDLKKF